jgi:hypothetical protein
MNLTLLSALRNPDGTWEIEVKVNNKENSKIYTYILTSEFAVSKFMNLYRKSTKLHGKALAVLNKHKLKGG